MTAATPATSGPGELFARVVVPVPVDQWFHYRVPAELHGALRRGDRVRVRFHGRTVLGTVLELDTVAEVADVLEIQQRLGEEHRIVPELLDLCEWVARHSGASLGETLDAALPPPLRRGRRPRLSARIRRIPGEEGQFLQLLEALAARAPKQARALRLLQQEGGDVAEAELCRLARITAQPLRALAAKGHVERYLVEDTPDPLTGAPPAAAPPIVLTPEQDAAVRALQEGLERGGGGFLLFGVTGSGKTEVYLRALRAAVDRGRRGIALVPEIALTPQTVARFRSRFSRIAVLHSALSEGERLRQWRQIRRGAVDVVVGARSAIFAPVPDLGVIVVDEEHEPSFKQQNPPRYHARDVALERGRRERAVVILGSATPSLESFHAAAQGKLRLLELPHRVGGGALPPTHIVDLAERPFTARPRLLTEPLCEALNRVLARREQAILFLNRRGFARQVLCPQCRQPCQCPLCDVPLVFHRRAARLICHLCGHEEVMRERCSGCGSNALRTLGFGTERVEEELRRTFPRARIQRMDSDTTGTRGSHEKFLEAFQSGQVDFLLGTQMIAKGLDFPRVTLVGIVFADTSLLLPDFRAAERTFQLVAQVAGRAGRSERGGRVIIQTLQPHHPAIVAASRHDYRGWMETELPERRARGYPPFRCIVRVLISHADEERCRKAAAKVRARLEDAAAEAGVQLLGPAPCPIPRVRGLLRHQVLAKCEEESVAQFVAVARRTVVSSRPVRVTLDVDPSSLL